MDARTIKTRHTVLENPELMLEWNYERNVLLGFDPSQLGEKSNKTVWWRCPKGHEYDMRISQRTRGQGCPYCSNRRILPGFNDLLTTNPELLEQWDYDRNEVLPESFSRGSHEVVWWKCDKGHSYQQAINKKTTRKTGCPICSGHLTLAGVNDFATFFPELAKEWHPTKNGTLLPSQVSKKSGKKVWWICRYGHEWQAAPHDRATDNTGCPICAQRRLTSFPEQAIFYYVRKLYPDALNRYKDIFDNGMELDIYIPSIRVALEFDGARWHSSEEVHHRESVKYKICRDYGIRLIRVKEDIGESWKDVADESYIIDKKDNNALQIVIQAIIDSIDSESNMWTRKKPYHIHSNILIDLDRDANEIREYLTPIPNSLAELRPDLVKEWNLEKNGGLKPEMFGINSNDKVWWKCSVCGHEWQTSIIHRAGKRNSGCPICAKKTKGESFTKNRIEERGSLADNDPALAEEWNQSKNGKLSPADVTIKSNKKVWWKCQKCGYEWQSSPNNRSKGVGCPCCSGRVPNIGVNDFKTLYPEIAKEWNTDRNGDLYPEQFLPKSGMKVWWKCSVCGYEWQTEIRIRTNGHGCPKHRSHGREKG